MANALYDTGREAFLLGDISWDTDTISVKLIDTGTYTFSAAHAFEDALSGQVGSDVVIASGKTTTSGVADGVDITFSSVSGVTVEALVIFKDTGTPATSQLIAYIDTGTNLPVTPNGGDITITWDSGANKIFKL